MTSPVLRGGAAGASSALRSSLNFSQGPLASRRNPAMLVALKQASLPSPTYGWRSVYHMSTATLRPSRQHPTSLIGQSAKEIMRCTDARVLATAHVGSSSRSYASSRAAASRCTSRGPVSNGNELQSLRRRLSSGQTYLERDGKNDREKHPTTASDLLPSSPVGVRKILPKSLGAALTPHENIYTVPNLLTFSRVIAAPFIGYAILHDAHSLALGLFVYAGVSDLLDGWIARRWQLQTVVGSIVDPMADKLLMTILTVCLAAKGALPIIILGRDVGLAISAIYYRWISLPPPKTFMRYWDFSLPSAEVRPTTISKYNTFLQLALMGSTVVAPLVTGIEVGPVLIGLQYIVATTTIWSGLSYVFSKDAVKILSDAKNKKQISSDEDLQK